MEVLLMTTLVLGLLERINENAGLGLYCKLWSYIMTEQIQTQPKFFDVQKHFGKLFASVHLQMM